jgi:hypothetical protein
MKTISLTLGAAAALLAFIPALAASAKSGHEAAIEACSSVNPAQPVTFVNAVDDGSGIGFSLVWLNDKHGNLWMCDADAGGNVYAYALVAKDLLKGAGGELIGLQPTADGGFAGQPQTIAETVCAAYLAEGGKVLLSVPDGLEADPGFIVFVADETGAHYLCNATGDAMIWAFEPIGDPLSFPAQTS